MKPKVSIIMPIFNNERELKQSINSVLYQKFKDFELICVNDGSTDNTTKILSQFQKLDDRIIVKNVLNGGGQLELEI